MKCSECGAVVDESQFEVECINPEDEIINLRFRCDNCDNTGTAVLVRTEVYKDVGSGTALVMCHEV